MNLTEKHLVNRNNPLFPILDELCYKSKNLYNAALYQIRQEYFKTKTYCGYCKIQKEFQNSNQFDYRQLPAMCSQQILRALDQTFRGFFNSLKEFKKNPYKFRGVPKIPGYLDKDSGRYIVIYTGQSVSKKFLDKGLVKLRGTEVCIPTKVKYGHLLCIRIVHKGSCIVVEIVYEKKEKELKADNGKYASIDLGINNLATITDNVGFTPFVISGKPIKSFNHYYNKRISYYKSILSTVNKDKKKKWSKRLDRITLKRENKICDYFHKSTKYIVNQLVSRNINTLIVGYNQGWKQDTNIGRVNNQNFVQIPFYKFIKILEYKCRFEGINFFIVTEEYTSKCSFLDEEDICKHDFYCGSRIHRGLFKSKSGLLINADVNGSYNILRKCKPNSFENGIMGVVRHPIIIKL